MHAYKISTRQPDQPLPPAIRHAALTANSHPTDLEAVQLALMLASRLPVVPTVAQPTRPPAGPTVSASHPSSHASAAATPPLQPQAQPPPPPPTSLPPTFVPPTPSTSSTAPLQPSSVAPPPPPQSQPQPQPPPPPTTVPTDPTANTSAITAATEAASAARPQLAALVKANPRVAPYNAYARPDTLMSERVATLSPADYLAHSVQHLLIPSLWPTGLDPDWGTTHPPAAAAAATAALPPEGSTGFNGSSVVAARAAEVDARQAERLAQITTQLTTIDQSDPTRIGLLVEQHALQLVSVQRDERAQVVGTYGQMNSLAADRVAFRTFFRPSFDDTRSLDALQRSQRVERQAKVQARQQASLDRLCNRARDLVAAHRSAQQVQARQAKTLVRFHADAEREEQKRIERISRERLQALRADDEEAYLKLIDTAKDTRIAHLLKQTDKYLESLAKAVPEQQHDGLNPTEQVMAEGTVAGGTVDESTFGASRPSDEGEDTSKLDFFSIAHRIQEPISKQPEMLLGGQLKEYQIKGLQWMVSLYNNRLNGILADEMGLGKTIQTISLITYLIETKAQQAPYLVIVPLSTLTNWANEFHKWAPNVNVVVYNGSPAARKNLATTVIKQGGWQVLLTTYEFIIKDKNLLGKIKWVHMIIDEGHRMKNASSKLSVTLTQNYTSRYRLLLTGTPLQNSLPELWALLNFVLPRIFNSVQSFDEWFNTPFANAGGNDGNDMHLNEEEQLLIIKRLHKVLRPFLLRRLKKDVASELPDKVEKVIKCRKSLLQSKLYNQMTKYKTLFINGASQGNGKAIQGMSGLQNALMQLRKICNHPYMFPEVEDALNPTRETGPDIFRVAGKFELLDRVLPKLKATGHRVLVFFQMTQCMDIIEDFLRYRNLTYLRLDGTTRPEERSHLLAEFNKPDSPYFMFILSTRAGGLGLNLQSADTVIIYDSDWNPHQDLQAQDRAHRIGQTLEVRILRLITEKSVEEKILEIAHRKLDMDGKVIQAGKFDNNASNEERDTLLRAMLESADDEDDAGDATIGDDELNQIIARSEAEQTAFAQMDAERRQEDQAWWVTTSHKGNFPSDRMISEPELPDMFSAAFEEKIVAAQETEKNRLLEEVPSSRRTRNVTIRYNDELTEEQFLNALENDQDPEELAAAKRARSEKRKANAAMRAATANTTSDEDIATPAAPPVKRGRGRPPKNRGTPEPKRGRAPEDSEDDLPTIRKRRRASPSDSAASPAPSGGGGGGGGNKKKKTNDQIRRDRVAHALQPCYRAIEELVEEDTGRQRCLLFIELPNKNEYPDYRVLIRQPICLKTIKRRLDRKMYRDAATCRSDIRLMCENARTYNQEGSFVWHDANAIESAFNETYDQLVNPDLRGDEPIQAPILNPAREDPAQVPLGGSSEFASSLSSIEGTMNGASMNGGEPNGSAPTGSSPPTSLERLSLPRIPRRQLPDEIQREGAAHPLAMQTKFDPPE